MSECACGGGHHSGGGGPFSEGRELVDFVAQAHGGGLRDAPIPSGSLETQCQGCGASFTLQTFVGACPECGGIHAVAPPRSGDAANIQFAGAGYSLP
ncbi:MAG: hydrogenase maturation nickel metallochaperone HypA [Geopsychrobacter sp.]|nr:hydrogenase maturation nickel metallochaperone HypA [Geopsychrobacter sp.]